MNQLISISKSVSNTLKPSKLPIPIYNANLNVEPLYYTVKQAALVIGFDAGTLRNWISEFERGTRKRLFETTKKGGRRLVLISSFHQYLEGRDTDTDNSDDDVECQPASRGRGRPRNKSKDQLVNQN